MMSAYVLGLDIGSSSVKGTLLDIESGKAFRNATAPEKEMPMQSPETGWAEQDPDMWWKYVKKVISTLLDDGVKKEQVKAVGISYQMHGLVLVDKQMKVLRPSIIWCDSRAVSYGEKALQALGEAYCLGHCLNSPGNFTAAKLAWVKENEPQLYEKATYFMLPGDYIALRLTGEPVTTISGLSEGIFWDFKKSSIADEIMSYFGFDSSLIPPQKDTFSEQGKLTESAAKETGLPAGIPVSYRAGDQPNNALSLNVLHPGEVAATAGTSGVIYGILDHPAYDEQSRVNTFVHVNHSSEKPRYGVLLCVNGTGILNSWLRNLVGSEAFSYDEMNREALSVPVGADGLTILPFGNGAERVLGNKNPGASIHGLNFNRHGHSHLFRAAQEGIVFALQYGFEIMKQMGMQINTVRAGKANMFLSPLFQEAFANTTGTEVQLYNTDGAQGAARGAALGAGIYASEKEAFRGLEIVGDITPFPALEHAYQEKYQHWLTLLNS